MTLRNRGEPAGFAKVAAPVIAGTMRHAIVVSRFQDGKIVEDWASSDTLELIRQLGVWRSLLLVGKHHRLLRAGCSPVNAEAVAHTQAQTPDEPARDR
jgi:hypothetical protein